MNIILVNKYKDTSVYLEDENKDYFMCPNDDVVLYTGLDDKLDIYLYCIICTFKKYIGINSYHYLQKFYPEVHL